MLGEPLMSWVVHRARPVDLEFEARGILKSFVSATDERLVGGGYVFGGRPIFATGLACSECRRCKAAGVECSIAVVDEMDPYCYGPPRGLSLGCRPAMVTGEAKHLLLETPQHHLRRKKQRCHSIIFLSMQPPVFTRDGSPDKAEEWIEEVERIFEVLEVPRGNKVNYGSYMLKGDAKRWWKLTREIRFAGQQSISWRQFRDSFFSTYFLAHGRNKKMQEFLDLQQNHLSLEEYVTKYHHLEVYCPHLYTTGEARADKFIYGLCDGLRGRVMSSRPHDLDKTVTMVRRMEEDWART
ncbi:hypothetical protein EJ110_NYTH26686 [Nymphaea thermarum]|nr:hypothetical protein EJ110_NYTH26686 [Nymphaea thermarum]